MVKNLKHPDYFLLGITFTLLTFGIIILFSGSAFLSQEKYGNLYYFLKHQLLFGLVPGLVLAFLAFKLPIDFFKKWAPLFLLINLVFLVMVFLPKIGFKAGGASRWIALGPISFQPSEFLKLTFILYLAIWLSHRIENKSSIKRKQVFSQTFFAFIIIIGVISLLLILQPDVSTLGIIGGSAVLLYFLSNTPIWHTVLIILAALVGLWELIKLAPYRLNRLTVFLNPEADPMGIGYQIKQALIAIGSGKILGLGLGLSFQKRGFLPQSISDSIFAILAEETGFIGSFILVLLFFLFFWRGFRIGKLSQDKFSKLTAFGITFWITIQAFINIGSMIGILPLTGIPLPFISYGGSALISELLGVGILLNISKNT